MGSLSQGKGISQTLPSYLFSIPAQSTWLERPSPLHTLMSAGPSSWEACPATCFPAAPPARPHSPHPSTTYLGQQPMGTLCPAGEGPGGRGGPGKQGHIGFPSGSWAKARPESKSFTVGPATSSWTQQDPLSLALLGAGSAGSGSPQCSPGSGVICTPSQLQGGWPQWPESQQRQTRHLRGCRASSDPGTRHAQEPPRPETAESKRLGTGKKGLSWDEMKRDTGVKGMQLKADPTHRCRGLDPGQGEMRGAGEAGRGGEAEIRGKGAWKE